jgi:hypothetical protein
MLTPENLNSICDLVRRENIELADAVASVLSTYFGALTARVVEMERSLGILIDGQAYVEKLCAHLSDATPKDEPWRASLGDG